jgi:hypothetical protein
MKVEFANAQQLRLMIQVAMNAASTDEDHAALNGVCFEVREKTVWAHATDGKWAVRIHHELDVHTEYGDHGFRLRIPLCDCKAILAIIGDCEHSARIARDTTFYRLDVNSRGHLEWNWGPVEIVSPDVFAVWPKETAEVAYLDKIGLSATLLAKIGKAFSQAAGDHVPLKFAFHGEVEPISVTAQSIEVLPVDAIVMPCRIESDSAEEDPRQGKLFPEEAQRALDELVDHLEKNGATMTVNVPGRKPVTVGKRGKKAEEA